MNSTFPISWDDYTLPSNPSLPVEQGRRAQRSPALQQREQTEGVPAPRREAPVEPVESSAPRVIPAEGVLELHPQGYGFLRNAREDFRPTPSDVFLASTMVESLGLRPGNLIHGTAEPSGKGGPRLVKIDDVDGLPAEEYRRVRPFDGLTAITPENWLRLETGPLPLTTRVMDLLTPLGKGQRALIVSPPRAGKTVLLQQIAGAISTNYPKVALFVLLVDERPEEVTEFRRRVKGQVLASSLDREIEGHVRLSRLVVDRCKRLAERGQDVFLLIDSLTRMARAFNKWVGDSGRTMSGGVDIRALDIPKKLFASARAFEEGGSLTIVATALIETGSRMDDVIFEEFKGTGNMELVLDRQLADRRVWPAIDISRSGTRREELLLPEGTLHAVTMVRRTLNQMHPVEAMERLTTQLAKFKSNADFIKLFSGRNDSGVV
jgi:transcription termination factor Rho